MSGLTHFLASDLMFAAKKGITSFILPPGVFILLILLVSMGLIHRKRLWPGLVNLTVGLSLWALSTAPLANTLMQGLERDFPMLANPSGDVIILLGGGVIDHVPDLTGAAAPSPRTMGRVVAAVRLYQRLGLPIIVSGGGGAEDGAVAEAPVARRFLEDLGVPANMIIEEDRARDTIENARMSAVICRRNGFTRPIVLTSGYHLKRARLAFEAVDLPVTLFPAYFASSADPPITWRDWLPQASALYTAASALHEYLGLIYYRWVGR
jgi:uncharacterized SAM-binding protein YcdF (DUF218 family)